MLIVFTVILPGMVLNVSVSENSPAKRLPGKTPVETSIKISEEVYDHSDNFILADFKREADALTSTLIASGKDTPLLLVDHFKNAHTELKRLGAKNVYLLGSESVISEKNEKKLEATQYNVIRLAGNQRK